MEILVCFPLSVDDSDLENLGCRFPGWRSFHIGKVNTAFHLTYIPDNFIHFIWKNSSNLETFHKKPCQIVYADYDVTSRGDFGSSNIQPHQLDSYGVLDLRIGAKFNLGSLGAYAQVQGYNILDELYWARGIEGSNDLKEGFPSYGRTLNFSVKLNF